VKRKEKKKERMDGGGRQCGGRVRRKKKMCWSKGWIKERKMKGEGFNKEK